MKTLFNNSRILNCFLVDTLKKDKFNNVFFEVLPNNHGCFYIHIYTYSVFKRFTGTSVCSPAYFSNLNSFEAKKAIIISFLNYIYIFKDLSSIPNQSTLIYRNTGKNNLLTTVSKFNKDFINENSIYVLVTKNTSIQTVFPERLFNNNIILKNIIVFLTDSTIPATNWTKLLLLERLHPKLVVPRGIYHDFLIEHSYQANDSLYQIASNKIIVENAAGPADIGFISELIFSFNHSIYVHRHIPDLVIKEQILLHSNIKGSVDEINSKTFTGQSNCDIKYIIANRKTNVIYIVYADIKQTIASEKDLTNLYLKTAYNTNPFCLGIVDDITIKESYITSVTDKLLNLSGDLTAQSALLQIDQISDYSEKLHFIHQFILENCSDPKFRMALLFEQNIHIDLSCFNNYSVPDDLIHKVSPDIFQNQTKFNILTKNISSNSKAMLIENQDSSTHQRLRQKIIDDTLDNFNTMKIQKSPFLPDFFDKI